MSTRCSPIHSSFWKGVMKLAYKSSTFFISLWLITPDRHSRTKPCAVNWLCVLNVASDVKQAKGAKFAVYGKLLFQSVMRHIDSASNTKVLSRCSFRPHGI